jgi:histidine phosphatase superfamily protein (branch 1)
MGPVELVCLRHGESENVVAGASGQVPAAPLTAAGWEQVRAVRLTGITHAYASATVRARQTAEAFGVPVTVLAGLAEVGVGSRDGAVDAGLRRETADVLRAWVVDGDLDRRVGDGESGHEVLARMGAALDLIADRHPAGADDLHPAAGPGDWDAAAGPGGAGSGGAGSGGAGSGGAGSGGAGPGGGAGVAGRPVVVGHVASLTVVASVLCGLGAAVWGSPLPHAVPFVLRRDGTRWHCPRWPG